MMIISELISAFNTADQSTLSTRIVRKISEWVTFMVNVFGLNGQTAADSKVIGWSGISIPDEAKPFVYPLSRARDGLRQKAKSGGVTLEDLKVATTLKSTVAKETAIRGENQFSQIAVKFANDLGKLAESDKLTKKDVLQLCDRLRDVDLWNQGIYFEDVESSTIVRPVTKEAQAARRDKEERDMQRERARAKREQEASAKAEKGRQSHLTMFQTKEYGSWNDEGIPLTDADGKEISKSQARKLKKEWEKQKSLHEAWLESNSWTH